MPATVSSPGFTYTLRQVAPRDEMVFKSVVRVLQGKTRHNWLHTDNAAADLMLIGDQLPPATTGAETIASKAVIHVSTSAGPGFDGLTLPLRIADVIVQMDRAGALIASRGPSHGGTPVAASPQLPAALRNVLDNSHVQPFRDSVPADLRVSLSRWPEAALLQGDIRYLKLAAVLTGQPVSIVELAARTQFPIQLCQGFVDSLKASQLVRVMGELRDMPARPLASATIDYAGKSRPVQHHGLIARIRSRLEMIVGTSAVK